MKIAKSNNKKFSQKLLSKLYNLYNHFKENGLLKTTYFIFYKSRSALASSDLGWKLFFEMNPFTSTGSVNDYPNYVNDVWENIKKCEGLHIDQFKIDKTKFEAYLAKANYSRFSPYYEGDDSGREDHRTDKLLQHFISLEILNINQDDTFIDIASNTSPIRHIVKELYNCKVYSLDLHYPEGINGELVGSDAASMPFENSSISKMTLHCSYEHFANGADIKFLSECSRVLKHGGKVCIIPFYVLPDYCVRIDPLIEESLTIKNLEGAKKVYVRDYRVLYGRHYDCKQITNRLIKNAKDLKLTVIKISGAEQFPNDFINSHLALLIEKP